MNENQPRSYFDGSFWHLVGLNIGGYLLCLITLGIAFPWVYCWLTQWRVDHTVVDGKRLKFTGKGISLLGHFILRGWLLGIILTPLTLGLYAIYYFKVSLQKWEAKNTFFADSQEVVSSTTSTSEKNISATLNIGKNLQRILLIIAIVIGIGVLITDSVLMFRPSENYYEDENGMIVEYEFEENSLGIMDFLPYITLIIAILATGYTLIKNTKNIKLAAGIGYLISTVMGFINIFYWGFGDAITWYWYYLLLIIPAVLCFICFMSKDEV